MNSANAASDNWPRVVVRISVGLGLLGGGALLWLTYSGLQMVQWNAPRLAAAWAVAHGINIYGTAQSGPFLGWIYGPVFPLYFAPAAWLGSLTAFFAGAWLLNLLAALFPVALCLRPAARREDFVPLLVLYGVLLLSSALTQRAFLFLHVDTLCVGFGLLACWSLGRGPGTGAVFAAALFSTLAIGTKQLAVGLPIGLAMWLLTTGQYRLLGRYLFWLIVLSGLFWAMCFRWIGADRVIFNLWWFHLRNTSTAVSWMQLGLDGLTVALQAWPWLLGLGVAWWRPGADQPSAPAADDPGARLRAQLLWVALCMLPFGLLAASKTGSNSNSFHTVNYAAVWLLLALAQVWRGLGFHRRAAIGYLLLTLAALIGGGITAHRANLAWRPSRQLEADLDLARQHAGKLYMPWDPLVTLMTDRKIYPFDDALLGLSRAGFPASREAVLGEIPRGALIVYPDPVQSSFALSYLQTPPAPAAPPNTERKP